MDSLLTAFEEYLGIANPYCDVATYALIGYEFFLTCDEEINFLRAKNKRIIAMLLFLANRWSLIGQGSAVCHAYSVLALIIPTIIAIVSALRVYAVSNRNRVLSMMTLLLALVQVAVNIWKDVIYWDPASINLGIAKGIWNEVIILARACALASDTLVLAVTYHFSFKLRQGTGHLRWSTGASLTKVLVRDGTIFFVALFLMYLLEILAWHFGSMFFVSDFTLPLMSILVSRFLMNLRRAASSSTFTVDTQTPSYVRDGLDTTTAMSSLKFSPQGRSADPEDVGHADSDEMEQLDDPSIIVPAEEMDEYSVEMGGSCGEPASEPYIVTVSRKPGER